MSRHKQTVLIFEGPDRCGKTNISKELSKRLKIPYYKNSVEIDKFGILDDEYFIKASRFIDTYMSDFIHQTKMSIIFDRNYPSEYVYPRVFNRKQDISILQKIDEMHAKIGTRIIIPFRTSYAGIVDPVHPQINENRLRELDDLYEEFSLWSKCEVLRLNVDDEDLHREVNEVLAFLDDDII
jgi:thymidylate kinase